MRIDFNLAAANLDEAKYNYNKTIGRGGLERVSLSNMFYPTYKDINGFKTIASPHCSHKAHATNTKLWKRCRWWLFGGLYW